MLRAILSFLGPKQLLLVLDGCEQHAGDARRVVAAILEHCPNVRVLATSREPLRGPQERTFQLPPLSTPAQAADDRAGVLDSEAAQLFLQRARAAAPVADLGPRDVTALREICTRLDGIPLAIEIAAARCRVLSISEIAKRLDDSALVLDYARTGVATHQRTMRDIIAWAYDSLAPDHRSGLQALSLFRTAVTLEDIESLTDGLLQCSPIDFVTSLVECSLLLVEYGNVAVRYRLLEPIRDFAMEQVAGQDAAIALTRRHVDFHASNARRLALPEGGAEPGPAFDRLEAQRRNVYATLERVVTLEIADTASVELALAMTLFWKERGYVQEGYSILARLAEAVAQGEDAAAGSQQVLIEASSFARLAGEYSRSREYAARARAFAEKGGDRRGRGSALFELAAIEYSVGNLESARLQFEESYREFDSLGDEPGAARAQVDVALIELQRGHYDAAFAMLDAAIKALATSERRRWHMFAVSALGFTERFRGNYVQARQHSSAALRFAREIGDRALFNTCLANLGSVALAVNDELTLLSSIREGLKSTRSGTFPFSLVHYLEIACRYLFIAERFAACARLSTILAVLVERFEIVPPVEDFEAIERRWQSLRARLDAGILDALRDEARAASTEDCIDAALDTIDGSVTC
jgi:predicted ATPase